MSETIVTNTINQYYIEGDSHDVIGRAVIRYVGYSPDNGRPVWSSWSVMIFESFEMAKSYVATKEDRYRYSVTDAQYKGGEVRIIHVSTETTVRTTKTYTPVWFDQPENGENDS